VSRAEIKEKLIAAHRAADWEQAKVLSQMKERAKRRRFKGYCLDCGQVVRGSRCRMHANIELRRKGLIVNEHAA
jgi:hypothetical protein